jgi:hypothetical protein
VPQVADFTLITLPYNKIVTFDKTVPMIDEERMICLRFTLGEESTISFSTSNNASNGWSYITLFDENMEYINDGDSFIGTLPAGTYYLLVSDDEYNYNTGVYYNALLNIKTIEAITSITLPELLDNPTGTINYTSGLPFTSYGRFDSENVPLVQGNEEPNFRSVGENYFAVAYKITLAMGDSINIHHYHEDDAYLYLYKSDGAGGYAFVNSDDDGGGNLDSYIAFKATEAGDYYIVATTYSDFSEGFFNLAVWSVTSEPELPAVTSLACNGSNISVEAGSSENDVRMKLMELGITANFSDGGSVTITNDPFIWVISGDGRSASYLPKNVYGMKLDESVEPIEVDIDGYTGLNDALNEAGIFVYTSDRTIYVSNALPGNLLTVADISGKVLVRQTVQADKTAIPVSQPGLYIVRVGSEAAKIIVP